MMYRISLSLSSRLPNFREPVGLVASRLAGKEAAAEAAAGGLSERPDPATTERER